MPDAMYRRSLGREAEFVLLGSRTPLGGARAARFDALLDESASGAPLNWRAVLALCEKHRVMGLVGRQLSARGWKSVPRPAVATWNGYFSTLALQSMGLAGELVRACEALEAAGIPVVSFKGPTLAHSAYGNGAVRPSADIDLLVSRSQVQRAHEVLREMGYAHEANFSPAQEKAHLRADSVFNLLRPAPPELAGVFPHGFALELHWAITSPCLLFDLTFEYLAPRLGWMELPGTGDASGAPAKVRTLAPPDLLLILGVHGAKHLWERLLWICDVAQLIERAPDLDWDGVLRDAKTRGVERMTALGLCLARDVMGAALPREVETWLSGQPQALLLASRLRADLWQLPEEEELRRAIANNGLMPSRSTLETTSLLARAIDNPWKRIGLFSHIATIPSATERAQIKIPAPLDSLWWLVSPLHTVHKRVRGFISPD